MARIITSIPAANDLELHSIDIEQAFLPLYGNPSSPRALHKTMDAFFKSEGFDTIGLEESVWKRAGGGKYAEDIYVSAHDCLIACKSKDIMAAFKKEVLMKERLLNTWDAMWQADAVASERHRLCWYMQSPPVGGGLDYKLQVNPIVPVDFSEVHCYET
jgi:hypothetical protein